MTQHEGNLIQLHGQVFSTWAFEKDQTVPLEFPDAAEIKAMEADDTIPWALQVMNSVYNGAAPENVIDRPLNKKRIATLMSLCLSMRVGNQHFGATVMDRLLQAVPELRRFGRSFLSYLLACFDPRDLLFGCHLAQALQHDAIDLQDRLIELAENDIEEIRVEAVRALGWLQTEPSFAALRMLLHDSSANVQAAAASALCGWSDAAADALPDLFALLGHTSDMVRLMSVMAIAEIHAGREDLGRQISSQLIPLRHDTNTEVRVAALFASSLVSPHDPELLAHVLTAWQSYCVDDDPTLSMPRGAEVVLGRECLNRLLEQLAPKTMDQDLNDFFKHFLTIAFHPDGKKYVLLLTSHDWYRKVQASQLARLNPAYRATTIENLLDDAAQEFALLLLKKPTLGITAQRLKELPGFVENHAKDVAKLLCRRLLRESPSWLDAEMLAGVEQSLTTESAGPFEQVVINEMQRRLFAFAHDQLTSDERQLLRLRTSGEYTWKQTAQLLGISVAQARYQFKKAADRLATELRLPADGWLLSLLPQLFCVTLSDGASP